MSQPGINNESLNSLLALFRALGNRVRHHREAAGLTRAELAAETDLALATIRQFETSGRAELKTWAKLLTHPSMRYLSEQVRRQRINLDLRAT